MSEASLHESQVFEDLFDAKQRARICMQTALTVEV